METARSSELNLHLQRNQTFSLPLKYNVWLDSLIYLWLIKLCWYFII